MSSKFQEKMNRSKVPMCFYCEREGDVRASVHNMRIGMCTYIAARVTDCEKHVVT